MLIFCNFSVRSCQCIWSFPSTTSFIPKPFGSIEWGGCSIVDAWWTCLWTKSQRWWNFILCLMCLFLDLGQNMLVLSIICALSWINQIINKMNLVCIGLLAMSCWNLLCKWPYGTYLWSRGKLLVCRFTFVPKVSTLECLKDQVAHEVERINEEQGSGSRSTRNKFSHA